jgi:hypothetical protein
LQLDEAEHAHLFDLTRAANTSRRGPSPRNTAAGAHGIQRILDGMTEVPAIVRSGRLDILSANKLGYALYSPVYADPTRPANLARFAFLDPQAHQFYPAWDKGEHIAGFIAD